MSGHRARLVLAALALVVLAIAGGGLRDVSRPTAAAWSDTVYARAHASVKQVTSEPRMHCTVMVTETRKPRPGVACRITSIEVQQWQSGPGSRANLIIRTESDSKTTHQEYLALDIDLSLAKGWTLPFDWAQAAVHRDGQNYTLAPGYPCSALPIFVADLPHNAGNNQSTYVPMLDYRSQVDPAELKCVP